MLVPALILWTVPDPRQGLFARDVEWSVPWCTFGLTRILHWQLLLTALSFVWSSAPALFLSV